MEVFGAVRDTFVVVGLVALILLGIMKLTRRA